MLGWKKYKSYEVSRPVLKISFKFFDVKRNLKILKNFMKLIWLETLALIFSWDSSLLLGIYAGSLQELVRGTKHPILSKLFYLHFDGMKLRIFGNTVNLWKILSFESSGIKAWDKTKFQHPFCVVFFLFSLELAIWSAQGFANSWSRIRSVHEWLIISKRSKHIFALSIWF